MARKDDDSYQAYGYGTEYLTPDQRIREEQLAPQRLMEASMGARRAVEAARNPLIETGPQLAQMAIPATAPAVVPVVPAPASNPLVGPPVPLSTMGTDQRIAWQQLQDAQRAQQADTDARLLDSEVKRTERELKDEERRQSIAMRTEIPKLQEAISKGDLDRYLILKADLVNRYPVGSGSIDTQRTFKSFDDVVNRKASVEDDVKKAATARSEAARQKRLDAGYKEAEKQGADVLREYAAIVDKDPVKGPDDANKFLGEVQQRNAIQGLRDAGLSDQDIAQKYGGGQTGRPFDYQAAGQAPKGRAAVAAERNKATSEWLALDKRRTEAGFDPSNPADTPEWTPQHEQAYQNKLEYMQSLTPQIGDSRAGVAGMATKYVPYERQLNPAARVAQPGAVPQQRPSAVVTAPKAVPPPLNPAYPEQWVGGKRYVQMPDGKLYLSKVQ